MGVSIVVGVPQNTSIAGWFLLGKILSKWMIYSPWRWNIYQHLPEHARTKSPSEVYQHHGAGTWVSMIFSSAAAGWNFDWQSRSFRIQAHSGRSDFQQIAEWEDERLAMFSLSIPIYTYLYIYISIYLYIYTYIYNMYTLHMLYNNSTIYEYWVGLACEQWVLFSSASMDGAIWAFWRSSRRKPSSCANCCAVFAVPKILERRKELKLQARRICTRSVSSLRHRRSVPPDIAPSLLPQIISAMPSWGWCEHRAEHQHEAAPSP